MCKKLIKNSQPFGKKFQKTVGGDFILTHTVDRFIQHTVLYHSSNSISYQISFRWKNWMDGQTYGHTLRATWLGGLITEVELWFQLHTVVHEFQWWNQVEHAGAPPRGFRSLERHDDHQPSTAGRCQLLDPHHCELLSMELWKLWRLSASQ